MIAYINIFLMGVSVYAFILRNIRLFAVDRVNESGKFSLRFDNRCHELVDPLFHLE